MPSSTTLGTLVETARKAAHKSRPDLARDLWDRYKIKADQSWVSRVERGETERPDRERLVALAEILELEPDDVLSAAGYSAKGGLTALPDALTGTLLAWEPWELELLQSELGGLRERYRSIREMLGASSKEPGIMEGERPFHAPN